MRDGEVAILTFNTRSLEPQNEMVSFVAIDNSSALCEPGNICPKKRSRDVGEDFELTQRLSRKHLLLRFPPQKFLPKAGPSTRELFFVFVDWIASSIPASWDTVDQAPRRTTSPLSLDAGQEHAWSSPCEGSLFRVCALSHTNRMLKNPFTLLSGQGSCLSVCCDVLGRMAHVCCCC
jgi:hypothetical protein